MARDFSFQTETLVGFYGFLVYKEKYVETKHVQFLVGKTAKQGCSVKLTMKACNPAMRRFT